MFSIFAFISKFYPDGITSYSYRSVSADYHPRGNFVAHGYTGYEEIVRTVSEINALINELANA